MISLDGMRHEEAHTFTFPLSQVSTAAFVYSSDHPIEVSLVDPDGEVKRIGTLPPAALDWHKVELRNYAGLRFEVKGAEGRTAALWMDLRHKVGEKVSQQRVAVQAALERVSEQERTRRIVMQAIRTLQVMPSEDQLTALETQLDFSFDEEGDFGEYLEPVVDAGEVVAADELAGDVSDDDGSDDDSAGSDDDGSGGSVQ